MSPPLDPNATCSSVDPSDDDLADRARDGEVVAFNALVGRYQRSVFGLSLRMLSSPAAAEDAAQDTFISAWRGIGGYRGGSFQAWILRIAGNQCRDELRKRKRRPVDSLDDLIENEGDGVAPPSRDRSPESHAMGGETAGVIQQGLLTLPEEQRMAVLLSDVQGLAYEEVAQAMGTSIGTVKSRISRGRARLREFLTARGELPSGHARLAQQEESQGHFPARSSS
jgi:RNA polymerase sigma-70 factor (ECF subfamily)